MPQIHLLILSDTHGKWPYSPSNLAPKVDVLIHCGDLTQVGGLPSFTCAIEDIKTVDAELKLVIAGNHDLELDERWVRDNMEDDEDLNDHAECVAYMKGLKSEGIHYLDEGTHSFELHDGRKFTVYASPYTPAFNGYAFSYAAEEDRSNYGAHSVPGNVDIVMTHGPPLFPEYREYTLDTSRDGAHCGCRKLAAAVQRVAPRLHCFGHIHEGRGAARVSWKSVGGNKRSNSFGLEVLHDDGIVLDAKKKEEGIETLLVNAAIHGESKGWLVDFET